MQQTKVAGTVILNMEDGHKKFLVEHSDETIRFVKTDINDQFTSLACILKELKETVHLNTNELELVELTNVQVEDYKMPLFVFSIDESQSVNLTDTKFVWEEPAILREVLQGIQFEGVPYLC